MKSTAQSRQTVNEAVASVHHLRISDSKHELGDFYPDYCNLLLELSKKGWKRMRSADCWLNEKDLCSKPAYVIMSSEGITKLDNDKDVNQLNLNEDYFISRWELWNIHRGSKYKDDIKYKMLALKHSALSGKHQELSFQIKYKTEGNLNRNLNDSNSNSNSSIGNGDMNIIDSKIKEYESIIWNMLVGDILLDCDSNVLKNLDLKVSDTATAVDALIISSEAAIATATATASSPTLSLSPIDAKTQIAARLKHQEEMGADTSVIHASFDPANIMMNSRQLRYNKVGHHTDRYQPLPGENLNDRMIYDDEYPDEEEYAKNHAPKIKNTVHDVPKPKPGRVPNVNANATSNSNSNSNKDVANTNTLVPVPVKANVQRRGTTLNIASKEDMLRTVVSQKQINNNNNDNHTEEIEMEDFTKNNRNMSENRDSVFGSRNPLHQYDKSETLVEAEAEVEIEVSLVESGADI